MLWKSFKFFLANKYVNFFKRLTIFALELSDPPPPPPPVVKRINTLYPISIRARWKRFIIYFGTYCFALVLELIFILTLRRPLLETPGVPGAGQVGHFGLSRFVLRGTEVIATNTFFQKQRAPFSDRYNYSIKD